MGAAHALPAEGDVLGGKYRLVRKLGSGGMGVVFEAQNLTTDARVAVKLLRPDRSLEPGRKERLFREARATARLRSPFVARVFDLDRSDEAQPVLVMELLRGHDLGEELRRDGKLPIGVAASYLVQACAGVAEAHALGLVHRDLKPANLFLETSSGTPTLRVLDFGLSKFLLGAKGADLTGPNDAIGTLSFMSPEQLRGANAVDARTDVWSLGLVLYRALAGELPFGEQGLGLATRILRGDEVLRLPSDLAPEWLSFTVAKALAKEPQDRYPDARALGLALAPHLSRMTAMTALAIEDLQAAPPGRDVAAAKLDAADEPVTLPGPTKDPTTKPTPAAEPDTLPRAPDPDRMPTLPFAPLSDKQAADVIAATPRPRVDAETAADLSDVLATAPRPRDEAETAADLSDVLATTPRSRAAVANDLGAARRVALVAPRAARRARALFLVVVLLTFIAAFATAWLTWFD